GLLVLLGARLLRRRSPAAALVALHPPIVIAFYGLTNPMMFRWYECTFVPLATLFAILGLVEAARWLPDRVAALRYALAVTAVVLLSIAPVRRLWLPLVSPASPEFSFRNPNAVEAARTFQYLRIGRWLRHRARPDDRVCISEIGAFGYAFRGK